MWGARAQFHVLAEVKWRVWNPGVRETDLEMGGRQENWGYRGGMQGDIGVQGREVGKPSFRERQET